MTLVYEPKTIEWVYRPDTCNSNNHPTSLTPQEYREALALTEKSEWSHIFPDPPGSIQIPLSKSQCVMLAEAAYVGCIAGRRPALYEEELLTFQEIVHEAIKDSPQQKWFIRFNAASPKDGVYGCGPLLSAKEIVTSISTSLRGRNALVRSMQLDRNEILYLIPWREDYDPNLEFRVFVHNRKVTCFSQYIWGNDLGWTYETLRKIAPDILRYCDEVVIPKMTLSNFVVDVIVIRHDSDNFHVEVVEFNSFGAELASGSALFHWIHDHDIMYGDGSTVIVRYVTK